MERISLRPTEAGTESNPDWRSETVFSTDGLSWLGDLGIQLLGLQMASRGRIQHALVPAGLVACEITPGYALNSAASFTGLTKYVVKNIVCLRIEVES